MKAARLIAFAFVAYVGIVVAFESSIGFFQPGDVSTLVITTVDDDGAPHDRVVSSLVNDGKLYVATNHWVRGWYYRALANSDVEITFKGETGPFRVISVEGAELERVANANRLGVVLRFLTGFPPRYFVRLDPS
jgi:uncharacterized pyridoxamine 5'-phosphate oxidase family protein